MSMSALPRWFDRRFQFPYPTSLLPALCSRLRGTPARLEETMRGRSSSSLTVRADGRWSAQENAGHLADLEPLWRSRVEDFVASRDQLTEADLTNRNTDAANHNLRPLEAILTEFRAARHLLMQRVDELDASQFARAIPHPRLRSPMRLADHLFFVAEHDDHHLARISELIQHIR